MPGRFLIYGLVDPRTGHLRYVGKSTSGMRRPRAGNRGKAMSPQARERISASLKGHTISAETRAKISDSLKGRRHA